ncbi:hypothetical protein NEOLEDRAFT_1245464 [Neolentinus lepideus HHB14362 ss-1]|uniref:DH domain-containing protein n=1 Tax=Neolentinus lepideus HHB14362 ss-1 TaxID=1314782 RepID=A0A165NS31_9AGAM|nr:hypothetical protein NEOLEDRAFT_1245464 [Neolentinus lepideus HHB14362 ss-1]
MSLMKGKSNRANSRSPASHSFAFQEQDRSRFFPPSYYAAAAGVRPHEETRPRGESFHESLVASSPIPVACPSDSGSDNLLCSSRGFSLRRSGSNSSKKSFQSSSSGKSDRSYRRQTQLESIEAQLLPSLRDTIDRMTHPNLQGSPRPESTFSPHSYPSPGKQYRSQLEDNSHATSHGSSAAPSLTPRILGTPRVTPMPSNMTPKVRPRSILKSTPDLRSSALGSPIAGSVHPQNVESPKAKSLRSAKSVSTRTRRMLDPDEGPPHDSRTSHLHAASKLDDDSLQSQPETLTRSRARSVTAVGSPISHRSTARMATNVATTHLPRRLGDSRIPSGSRRLNFIGGNIPVDDSSSSEIEYDAEGRNSRILVVANADVVPSSSSDSEGGRTLGKKPSRLPVFSGRSTVLSPRKQTNTSSSRGTPIGLGLDIRDNRNIAGGALQMIEPRHDELSRGQTEDDDVSVYEDESDKGHSRTLTGPFSWNEDGRLSTSKQCLPEPDQGPSEDEQARRRRQEALVDIVDGLQSTGTLTGLGNAMLQSASDSATSGSWHGGLAISGSKDFAAPDDNTFSSNEELAIDCYPGRNPSNGDDNVTNSDYSDDEDLPSQGGGLGVDNHRDEARGSRWASPLHNRFEPGHDDSCRGRLRTSAHASDRTSRSLRPLSMPAAPSRPLRPDESLYPLGKDDLDPSGAKQHGSDIFGSGLLTKSAHRHSVAASSPSRLRSVSARPAESQSSRPLAPRSRTSSALGTVSRNDTAQYEFQDASGMMSKSDSYSSSVGEMHRWREQSGIFSHGAEALFERLGNIRNRPRNDEGRTIRSPITNPEPILVGSPVRSGKSTTTTYTQFKDAISDDSNEYSHCRGLVLKNFYISEQDFLADIRPVVISFVQPLRKENRKSWVNGVPPEIASFLDWFEDIVNFHTQFCSILRSLNNGGRTVQERMCQTMLRFLPKLEVYQPYLVQYESVVSLLDKMILDKRSDFGEFVRIQQKEAGISTSSLKGMLSKPKGRLDHYLTTFQQLLEATPKTHMDYLPAFSLLSSTRQIVKVMLEVKAREDEYQEVKELLSRIDGLPAGGPLARRERRLLTRGNLSLLERTTGDHVSDRAIGSSFVLDDKDPNLVNSSKRSRSPVETSRQSRLSNALLGWNSRRSRSRSTDSHTSSFPSFDSVSSGLSDPAVSSSGSYSESRTLFSPSPTKAPKGYDQSQDLSRRSRWTEFSISNKPTVVVALVFTDLLVLAKPSAWREFFKWKNLVPWISLDLLPVDVEQLETGEIPDDASLTTVRLVPEETSCEQGEAYTEEQWLAAFRQSSRHTLCSLSFPTHSGKYLAHGSGADLENDTRQAVMSILASGLPMPKSPSVQIQDVPVAQEIHLGHLEREGRGWWAMRFQQVYREMRRTNVYPL